MLINAQIEPKRLDIENWFNKNLSTLTFNGGNKEEFLFVTAKTANATASILNMVLKMWKINFAQLRCF
ncbi:hypothetical protein BpHYR1_046704 [Brachionus plicatilis]|uniref:Uncharacterized protein n=1 Tax=Brachionus plicatilis TaxID=10195 RepID=A0A3M7S2R9_BRAPC|nr:hypothetical protein BpHYR1_046704 [Brachionus plicatilis]